MLLCFVKQLTIELNNLKERRRSDVTYAICCGFPVFQISIRAPTSKKMASRTYGSSYVWNDGTKFTLSILLKMKGERDLDTSSRYTKAAENSRFLSLDSTRNTLVECNIGYAPDVAALTHQQFKRITSRHSSANT